MKEFIQDVINAIFVLPFTAGRLTKDDVNCKSHDGTITGPVLFAAILAILCQIFILGSSEKGETVTSVDVLSTLLTVLTFLAVLCCVTISIYSKVRPDVSKDTRNWNISLAIEIRFYWLFSLACMAYYVIKLCFHIDCFHRLHQYVYIPEAIAYDVGFFLFYLFQTGFFTRYLHFEFVHHLGIYYGLMILGVTNISIFCREFVLLYNEPLSHVNINDTSIPSIILTCHNVSSTYVILSRSKPFLHPAVFEYSLLTMIFLSKVWPKDQCEDQERNLRIPTDYENIYDSIDVGESSNMIQHGRDSGQPTFALLSVNTTSAVDISRRTRKFISISLGVILNIPAVVLHILRLTDETSYTSTIASISYNIFKQAIILFLNVRCFHMMRRQCEPRQDHSKYTASKYLLLISSCGIMSYYTLVLYARMLRVLDHDPSTNKMEIALEISRMVSTYLQTVFLLQMKYYHRTIDIDSWISIEFLCLFLSVENLGSWAVNTFVDSQAVFKNDSPFQIYGADFWSHMTRFWYPFIIFYRFKCFVMFYSYYHMLK